MIEINLLPEEMRKTKANNPFKLDLEMDKVKFLAGGVAIGVLVLLTIIPLAGSSVRKKQIMNLVRKEALIGPQSLKVQAVEKELSILKAKMAVLDEIARRKFSLAMKLNELSDMVLPGIWFTSISEDSDEGVKIEGSVISKKEKAMASVGKFINDIRGHASFFKDFTDIKLESVQRKSVDGRDVVDFKIVLYF